MQMQNQFVQLTNIRSISRLDTSAAQPEYLIVTNDGRSLYASSPMGIVIEAMWKGGRADDIAEQVALRLGRPVNVQDVEYILKHFVEPYHLIRPDSTEHLRSKQDTRTWLIGLPILSPALLRWITRPAQRLFSWRSLLVGLILIILVQAWFYLAHAANFSFASLSGQDYLMVWILYLIGILVHELGHVSACTYYQCPHGPVGIGLYGFFPVFYADVSQVWSLERRQRAVVDVGGMFFQALSSAVLVILYAVTGRAFLAGAVIVTNILIIYNLNPLLKFDGYWLLSDLLGIPNLQKRALIYLVRLVRFGAQTEPDAPPATKLTFKLYALAVLAFACYFGWMLARYVPGLIKSYPSLIGAALDQMHNALSTGAWDAFAGNLLHLVFPSLFILGLGRMLWLAITKLFDKIRLTREAKL